MPIAIAAALVLVAAAVGALTYTFFAGDDSSDQFVTVEDSDAGRVDSGTREVDGGDGPPLSDAEGDVSKITAPEPDDPAPLVTSPPTVPSTSPPPTTTTPVSAPTGDVLVPGTTPVGGTGTATASHQGLSLLPRGSWAAVLESIPHSEGLVEAENRASAFPAGTVHLLDTADHPAMTPGYYAVVIGPYGSEDGARGGCSLVGREAGGACYPRLTS